MQTDPFATQLRELDRAILELTARLEQLREALGEIRRMHGEGLPVSEIVASGPGAPARRDVIEALANLNRSLHAYRAQLVEAMVDREGLSIADAARVTGNARQVVSRLYHSAEP